MNNKDIYIELFGEFAIKYGDKSITMTELKSNKLLLLFSYFLFHQGEVISSKNLITYVWAYENIDNPTSALKNLVYRLRTVLKKKLELDDVITTGRGSYRLNAEYNYIVDALELSKLFNSVESNNQDNEFYEKALDLYKGDFLSDLRDDRHVAAQTLTYKRRMTTIVYDYAKLLEKQEDYARMHEVAARGVAIDHADEGLYALAIKGLYHQKKYDEAANLYSTVVDRMYHLLGTSPSAELQSVYALIQRETHSADTNILDIVEELKDAKDGALFVEYGTFKDLYRLQSRIVDRIGFSSFVCLITIKNIPDTEHEKKYLEKTMNKLRESLEGGLRVGDVICRYSFNQYITLLSMCNYEDARNVMDRVTANIQSNLSIKEIPLELSWQEVK